MLVNLNNVITSKCPNSIIGLKKENNDKIEMLPCKTWSCSTCNSKKSAELKKFIAYGLKDWKITRFATLTLGYQWLNNKEHYLLLQELFRRLTIAIRRNSFFDKNVQNFEYIRINELTQKKYTHIHFLTNSYLPQKVILSMLQAIIKQIAPKSEHIDNYYAVGFYIKILGNKKTGIRYITKYLTKNLHDLKNRPFFRIWTKSQNCKSFPKKKKIKEKCTVLKFNPFKSELNLYFFEQLHRFR